MKALRWPLGVVLAAAAVLITAVTPSDDAAVAPFVATAGISEEIVAREVVLTVEDVVFAGEIVDDGDPVDTDGDWLAVTLTAASVDTPTTNWFTLARLEIGDTTYALSRRIRAQFTQDTLQAGLPLTGFLVFEVPKNLPDGDAALLFTQGSVHPQLDSLVRVELRLDELPFVETVEIADPEPAP